VFFADFEEEALERETWIINEETLGLRVFVGRFSCVRETSKTHWRVKIIECLSFGEIGKMGRN